MTIDSAKQDNVPRNGGALSALDPQQREAIIQFRQEHGRRWKHQLLQGWMRAAFPGPLQQIRNNLGPAWLVKVKDADFREQSTVKEDGSGVRGYEAPVCLTEADYDGERGNKRHRTRRELVLIPVAAVAQLSGARGEKRDYHETGDGKRYFGNFAESDWQAFKEAINRDGMNEPITINIDLDEPITIFEGNHRLQAAIQSGWKVIAADIRYYGKAETMFQDNSFFRQVTEIRPADGAEDAPTAVPARQRMR
ncbi:ParB N-terminal domain-containing protein [Caballeronia sp. EK]|uniref:ParB N-terminal domain-containing protein n=1 Tax=Caballeronia sp. EK TaxID=2767469 RepID=UPI0016552308|nr:ParB N-terminal domain-containing protein [Caballeronia sp. EK]MBC8641681.1 ParB N-terminal domain-containing protein [Caballeronia sp. EK]